jgi:hypothetical protein
MAITYSPIATTTLGSATNTVTFSSISGSYTDLVAVFEGTLTSGSADLLLRFNSDTGSNYSSTHLYGTGSSAASSRFSNATSIKVMYYGYLESTGRNNAITSIQNYSNSTTYKTTIARANNADTSGTNAGVGLWRNTNAITSITFLASANNFETGSNFTLYGIASA